MRKLVFIIFFLMSFISFAQNKKSFLRDGNKLYADSSYNESEIQYRKSLEKDQNYFKASFNLADAIYKQGRYEEASALFSALKDNAPTETYLAKVYHNLGNSLFKQQKLEEAITAYKSALRITPNDEQTRHNLALSKKQKQKQDQQGNKDSKQDQKENKDVEKKEEQKENQQQENKENQQKKNEEQQKQPKEKKEEMSKEDAEKMLEAIEQQEKDLQQNLQKKKVKGKRVQVLKDW